MSLQMSLQNEALQNDTSSQAPGWLTRPLASRLTAAGLLLAGIMLLSLILHLVNIDSIGDANTYYTAAVKSMLQSWHNFFFVVAEPGGSVTVDKPPLGLWVEAAFAAVLGVSGWAVSLPNILAGVLSVPLLYHLVKRHFGAPAGLVAALVLALTPVALAVNRNNTMDGMLVFTLLLAAWAFVQAAESGRLRFLLLGALLVGLGFNIKMLQALLPLPAFYALYFLAAQTGWLRKLLNLGLATAVLVAVSLSWALIVDAVPADQRPYVGSSTDNTVMELIAGHNGASRLFGPGRGTSGVTQAAPQDGAGGPGSDGQPRLGQPVGPGGDGTQPLPGARPPTGQPGAPAVRPGAGAVQPGQQLPPGQPGVPPGPGGAGNRPPQGQGRPGGGTHNETGDAGLLRFFRAPLAKEASWLLPFGLAGMLLVALAARPRLPLQSGYHKGLILWGGWLLTCLVFFSFASFFHAYYMIMLAPALGAVVGGGFALLCERPRRQIGWLPVVLMAAAAAGTLAYQFYLAFQFGVLAWWLLPAAVLLLGGAALLAWPVTWPGAGVLRAAACSAILAALLVTPGVWSMLTVLSPGPNVNLPSAYDGSPSNPSRPATGSENDAMLAYLQTHTADTEYLLAVPNAFTGAPYVLATGRPVLYMGGFSGGDPVVDAGELAQMVADGRLRYVLYQNGQNGNGEIAGWLRSSCSVVSEFSQQAPAGPGGGNAGTLYACGTATASGADASGG